MSFGAAFAVFGLDNHRTKHDKHLFSDDIKDLFAKLDKRLCFSDQKEE